MTTLKRSLATAAVLAGLLASAAPAHAHAHASKNEVSIETLEVVHRAPQFNLPEVEDEVL